MRKVLSREPVMILCLGLLGCAQKLDGRGYLLIELDAVNTVGMPVEVDG